MDGEDDDNDKKSKRKAIIFRISFAFIFLNLALFASHITACVRLIQYGNEVLYQHEDYDAGSLTDDGESTRNDRGLTISYVVISLFFGGIIIVYLILLYLVVMYSWSVQDTDQASPISSDDQILGAFTQVSLGGFVGYLIFYFTPYMLLAFINDPVKTIFIYMMGALFILCFCLVIKGFFDCYSAAAAESSSDLTLLQKVELFFAFGSGTSLAYFLIIVIFLFMLGNFNDFQAVHNLTLPIIIIIVPVLVFKPLYGNLFKPSGENNVTNETNTGTTPTTQNPQQMNNVINNDDAQE